MTLQIPVDVEAIVIVGTARNNKSDDTVFSGLESATLSMKAANKSEVSGSKSTKSVSSSKSKSSGLKPSYYDLANYTTNHTDVGASGSLVGLFFCGVFLLNVKNGEFVF